MPSGVPKPGESLADLYPAVAQKWDHGINGDLRPDSVAAQSHKVVAWKCEVADDHRWTAPVSRMSNAMASGCPFCVGKRGSSTNNLRDHGPADVVSRWDFETNAPWQPEDFPKNSGKKVWWKCPIAEDHRWQAAVAALTRGSGCPCCAGLKPSSTNNFRDHGPPVAVEQWDDEANGALRPQDVTVSSNKRFWWRCKEAADHRWQAAPNSRTRGHNCPYCHGLRASSTNNLRDHGPADVVAQWDYEANGDLRPEDLPVRSRKVVHWRCDVAEDHRWERMVDSRTGNIKRGCPYCRGYFPSSTNNVRDHGRSKAVAEWDYERNFPLRPEDLPKSSGKKVWWKCPVADDHVWQTSIGDRMDLGNDCPCCSGRQLSVTNSLTTLFPDVAAQWHPTKNSEGHESVVGGSHVKAWWKCPEGPDHEWEATISSRTHNGNGCPCCAGQKLSVTNSLATRFPSVAAQWHPTKNGDLTPPEVVSGTKKKVWWVCDVVSEHEWPATVINRTSHSHGCPHCTVVPRSAQEIRLAHELAALINFDLDAHKLRFAGRLRDLDMLIEDLWLVVEFDGAYWHRNKVDKDRQKTAWLEEDGWKVIRVRERPLESIHTNDVVIEPLTPVKEVADLVLKQIQKVTKTKIPNLKKYLASDGPWREEEALTAIRAYQAERVAAKAERAAKKATRSS